MEQQLKGRATPTYLVGVEYEPLCFIGFSTSGTSAMCLPRVDNCTNKSSKKVIPKLCLIPSRDLFIRVWNVARPPPS